MTDQLEQAQQGVVGRGNGEEKWDRMSEEQKKIAFDALPDSEKKNKTYTEWIKQGYNKQYESWMPWIEDQYLKWFTKDNKTSYAAKDTLDESKITGIEQVDKLQDGVHGLVAGQVGQGVCCNRLGMQSARTASIVQREEERMRKGRFPALEAALRLLSRVRVKAL